MIDKLHTFVVLAYKESNFLEECIKSVINQRYNSKIVIATSTPCDFITKIAKKYDLEVIINKGEKGIGNDFDFAIKCSKTKLVTVAHQDDIYDFEYSYNIVKNYNKNEDAIILFSDYYEIKNGNKEFTNKNLKIKRILLTPLLIKKLGGLKFNKRMVIALGNAICCPAVTFNTSKIVFPVFASEFLCDVDWLAWERLSKLSGKFLFVNKKLMGHRIHEESTTTEIIKDNIRTKEDYIMFRKFWPNFIAKKLNKYYSKSEDNNSL